jgi:4'-phosphopantetheinyl transferase
VLTTTDFQLTATEILILLLPLESNCTPSLHKILDESEHNRADRFLNPVHGQRFIIARAGLRIMLSLFRGCHPCDVKFHIGAFGKLYLDHLECRLQFNISHSEDLALMAFAFDGEVGIDIERVRPVQANTLAKHCFSSREQAELLLCRGDDQLEAFFRGWTRKESFVKAIGLGVSCPLDSFDVSLADSSDNVLTRYASDLEPSSKGWQTYSIATEPGFAAAVTSEKSRTEFRLRTATIADLLRLAQLKI